jgi:hypothetical protein
MQWKRWNGNKDLSRGCDGSGKMGIRIYQEDGWKGQNGNKDLPQGCSGKG